MTTDFDPFRAATAAPAPACPKCAWSPAGGASCEACGLIFERYAAAQRRAQSQAQHQTEPLPTTPMAVVGHRQRFVDESAGGIVGAATSSSFATMLTQLGMNIIPLALLIAVAFAGGLGVAIFAKALASIGMVMGVLLGIVAVVVVCLVASAVVAGTMLVVDEHMRTGDNRGAIAALGDGWALSGRVFGVAVLITVGALFPFVIAGVIGSKATAIPLAVIGVAWMSWFGLRTMLALPAAVLGGSAIGEALSTSWALTSDRLWDTAKVALLAGLVMGAFSGIGGAIGLIPIAGQIVGAVISIFVGGIYAGICAGLWRARDEG